MLLWRVISSNCCFIISYQYSFCMFCLLFFKFYIKRLLNLIKNLKVRFLLLLRLVWSRGNSPLIWRILSCCSFLRVLDESSRLKVLILAELLLQYILRLLVDKSITTNMLVILWLVLFLRSLMSFSFFRKTSL